MLTYHCLIHLPQTIDKTITIHYRDHIISVIFVEIFLRFFILFIHNPQILKCDISLVIQRFVITMQPICIAFIYNIKKLKSTIFYPNKITQSFPIRQKTLAKLKTYDNGFVEISLTQIS